MSKYRILVADDEPIERQVVNKKILEFFPDQVEVYLAENGIQAVEIFEEKECQVAILDIAMPGMTGLEAAKAIREKNKEAGIIFLTAYDDFGYAKKAIEVRALDYLLKPGSDEDLVSVLEQAFMLCDAARIAAKERGLERQGGDGKFEKAENESDGFAPGESKVLEEPVVPNNFITAVREYIETNYREDIALQDIAGVFGYSDVYFCKLFKQNFDMNFIAYLNEYRMDIAKKLLADPMINIKDISIEAGYRDANYFTRLFKRKTGMTPSEYRSGVLGS
ncbi:MAG: response regulator [Butyrivibrio sp.]|nr:response regulator [Butyrivibrio sp.]